MTRFALSFAAASLFAATVAQAAETKIVVVDPSTRQAVSQVADAAREVCKAALKNDAFGDFGSFDECVENTVENAQHIAGVALPATVQVSSSK